MVLAVGVVVDDAIVVLENIFRHIEDGMPPLEAALRGREGNHLGRHRHHHHAGGGVPPDRLPVRHHRHPVPRIRRRHRRRGGHLRLRGADAHADAVRAHAAAFAGNDHGRVYRALERFFTGDRDTGTPARSRGPSGTRRTIVAVGLLRSA